LFLVASQILFSQNHPNLILTKKGVADIRANLGTVPMFDKVLEETKAVASVIESHGTYNPVSETPLSPFSGLKSVEVIPDTDEYTVVKIKHESGKTWTLAIANKDASENKSHQVKLVGNVLKWQGPFYLK